MLLTPMQKKLTILATAALLGFLASGIFLLQKNNNAQVNQETIALRNALEQEELRSDIAFVSWKASFYKGCSVAIVAIAAIAAILLASAYSLKIFRESQIITQKIGQYSEISMHRKLAAQPEMIQLTAGMIQAEALRIENPEKFTQFAKNFLSAIDLKSLQQSQLPALSPAEDTYKREFRPPTFREVLDNGLVGKGKDLLIGFKTDGSQLRSTLEDNYSTVVIGTPGSGKTSGEAYSIAQALIAYMPRYTILDPHYPDKRRESLVDRLGKLAELPTFRVYNNPAVVGDVVRELDAKFEAHKEDGDGDTPHIIVVDEHQLWKSSSNGGPELLKFEEKMIFEGRKFGWYLHITSKSPLAQDFGSSAIRDNFVTSLMYRAKRHQARTFYKDNEVTELISQCKKPGQAVYMDIESNAHVVSIPYCTIEDMDVVYKQVANGRPAGQMHPISKIPSRPNDANGTESAKDKMHRLGLTQEALAGKANVEAWKVKKWMSGNQTTPKSMTDAELARLNAILRGNVVPLKPIPVKNLGEN